MWKGITNKYRILSLRKMS